MKVPGTWILLAIASSAPSCGEGDETGADGDGDSDGDSDSDADSDADGDSDVDSDSDADGDADGDAGTCVSLGGYCASSCDLCYESRVDGTCQEGAVCCASDGADVPFMDCVDSGGQCFEGSCPPGMWSTVGPCEAGTCCVDVSCNDV